MSTDTSLLTEPVSSLPGVPFLLSGSVGFGRCVRSRIHQNGTGQSSFTALQTLFTPRARLPPPRAPDLCPHNVLENITELEHVHSLLSLAVSA